MALLLDESLVFMRKKNQRKNLSTAGTQNLAESILAVGLLHPIVVRTMRDEEFDIPPDTIDHEPIYQLVAGERRLHAIRKIYATDEATFSHDGVVVPHGLIPVTDLGIDDAASVFEAELHENIIRVDLDWKDRVRAIDDLHKLKGIENPEHTISATAAIINPENPKSGTARTEVAHAKIIAEFLDDPAVAGARNQKEAYKIASRKIEAEFVSDLTLRGFTEVSRHKLMRGNAGMVMREMVDKRFDLIIADPPYGMGADQFGDAAELIHSYDDDVATAVDVSSTILHEGFNVTKDEAHLYMFCDFEQFLVLREMARDYGWTPFRTPLIWHKAGSQGHAPLGDKGFRRGYELILFASKGIKPFASLYSDVISVPPDKTKLYAAQKPIDLYAELIKRSCLPRSFVLDPCCGSGTIFPAAEAANCTGYGIESSDDAYGVAEIRLHEVTG
jgi:DNA modification methylase